MFRFAVFAVCVAVAFASSCTFPNNGALTCDACADNPIVIVDPSSVALNTYPPDLSKPVVLTFTYDNTASQNFDNLLVDVKVERFGKQYVFFGDCVYVSLPLPLNNMNGCKMADNCPLTPGVHPNTLTVDLSSIASVVSGLANGYYRLTINVKASDSTALGCLRCAFQLQ